MHTRKGTKKEGSTRTLIQKEGKANKTQGESMRVITAGGKRTKGGSVEQEETQEERTSESKQEVKLTGV